MVLLDLVFGLAAVLWGVLLAVLLAVLPVLLTATLALLLVLPLGSALCAGSANDSDNTAALAQQRVTQRNEDRERKEGVEDKAVK